MMKKYLLYIFFFTVALSSCKKDPDEPIIGDVDERLSAELSKYQTQLTSAQFGWKGYLLTDSDIPATFLFTFNEKNRVGMAADYDDDGMESSYRLKALQRPTLLFDSYSTLHKIVDPTPSVFGGGVAVGYYSDFEFAFLSASTDTIKLEGTFNKSKLILIRSKSQEESENVFDAVQNVLNVSSKLRTYFKRATIGGLDCEVRLDGGAQVVSFSYLSEGVLKSVSSNFFVSGSDVVLYTPLVVGTASISKIGSLSFDSSSNAVNATINGTVVQIKEAITPLKLDLGAAQRWYTQMSVNFNGCWVSDNAFHANGVDDFCNFRSVPNYSGLWYAGAGVFGGTGATEGIITFLTTNGFSAPYAFSKVPFTVNNGIAKFTLATNSGSYVGTTPIILAMTAARNILYGSGTIGSSQDWYLIPTSSDGKNYDMVRVSDAQAWISWRPR